MSYRLDFEIDNGFLKATVTGIRSLQTVIDISKDLFVVYAEKKVKKILVDIASLNGHLSVMESFEFNTKHFPDIRNRNIINKCAIIDRKENENEYRAFETIAVNRGYMINIFSDFNEAVAWLKKYHVE